MLKNIKWGLFISIVLFSLGGFYFYNHQLKTVKQENKTLTKENIQSDVALAGKTKTIETILETQAISQQSSSDLRKQQKSVQKVTSTSMQRLDALKYQTTKSITVDTETDSETTTSIITPEESPCHCDAVVEYNEALQVSMAVYDEITQHEKDINVL